MKRERQVFNPFSVVSYMGPEYFCDRQKETKELTDALHNGRNVTLISPRRIGKTGLIHHLFQSLDKTEVQCFYVDLYSTSSLQDFTKLLAQAVLTERITPFSEQVWSEITRLFSALRPVFTTDPISGMPQCMIDIQPQREEWTLQQIFSYLEKASTPCYVALDEFQTIAEYTDVKMEALLRTYIQQLHNVRFIFAGSKKHLMTEIFASAKRPFYRSTQMMHIGAIDEAAYYQFASAHMAAHGQRISEDTFHELYSLMDGYTWNMQSMLNRLYQSGVEQIDYNTILSTLNQVLQEEMPSYQTYCRLISNRQLQVLRAVAKEGTVSEPGSTAFLRKYGLGAYSTVRSAMLTMLDKELLYRRDDGSYEVYEKFFALWLRYSSF
ncbi:MAG: ATP-binding protein [Paludibacteraceae bacterium]|nr:ATP-binding protein [Paludibacteraceae bacterium]